MKGYSRNDFKLSFIKDGIKFYVNEKKRIVTCIVTAIVETPHSWDSCVTIPSIEVNGVGVAKCHADDVFDVERGKRIAMAKAENKAYNAASNYLYEYSNDVLFFSIKIADFFSKNIKCCSHNDEYIESVSNPEHPQYKKDLKKVMCGTTIINNK